MATVQQSIDIRVPAHAAYDQLTQFEIYPCFMEAVEAVQRFDDTHLHWKTRLAGRYMEWDAEIIEQQPHRSIAWNNTGGPLMSGKIEVRPVSEDASRVTFTLQADPGAQPGATNAGAGADAMAQRLARDLARFKAFIESNGETGAWREEIHSGQVVMRDRDARAGQENDSRNAPSPQGASSARNAAASRADAMARSMRSERRGEDAVPDTKDDPALKQAIERSVPPSA